MINVGNALMAMTVPVRIAFPSVSSKTSQPMLNIWIHWPPKAMKFPAQTNRKSL